MEQSITSDSSQIAEYQGRLRDLQARLAGIESSLAIQQRLLLRIQGEFDAARARLARLRIDLVRDRRLLAAQLVSQYESPAPDLATVVLESRGFSDLLERLDQMRTLARHNARVLKRVARDKARVAVLTSRLAEARAGQQRVTAAVLVERDQVTGLRLAILQHQRIAASDRARKQAKLRHVLAILQAQAVAAQGSSFATSDSGGASLADSGEWGFFPAPGTNYSVGEEPEIAARLDRLGKALHLHLIGLSGYRTPQHSVEVGGYADDPHTRGEASDTPGIEGVPEQTLLEFGLTRPFPGPAEADHIQLA